MRNQIPRPDFIVGHEEALFFSLFILLTACLWIFRVPGPLRTTATALLPLVLMADLVNSRRAAWLILGGELIALSIVTMVALPARRRFMGKVLAVVSWSRPSTSRPTGTTRGALAGPARAVKSAVAPEHARRVVGPLPHPGEREPRLNIREGGAIGRGFGVPIDYGPGSITDISSIDPMIRFVPHNGVLYILMRMGLFGGIAFWSLLGAGILTGCRLVRSRNPEVAVFGTVLACALVGYALEGYNDQGFFMYRIAFVVGTLLGLGEAARRIDARGLVTQPATAAALPARPLTAPRAARPAPRRKLLPAPAPALVRAHSSPRRFDRIAQRTALVLLPIAIGFFIWLVFAGAGNRHERSVPGHQTHTGPRHAPRDDSR